MFNNRALRSDALISAGADVNLGDQGVTPLCSAAAHGNKELIDTLMAAGADPNTKTVFGTTPLLSLAEGWYSLRTLVGSASALIAAGAAVDSRDKHGTTPLSAAVANGHRELADFLQDVLGRRDEVYRCN